MSINKYSTFLKVVEAGSITAAAASLGHTQSGVTQLLHSLEKDLGVCLLRRNRSGITLTEEGQKLYPYIERIVSAHIDLENAAASFINSSDTLLRIGVFKSVAVNWLPEIIKEYSCISPNTNFDLVDCGYNNIEETLSKNVVDFAFVPLPISSACRSIPIYKDPLLAILPKGHPLSSKSACPVSVFSTEPVISLIPTTDKDARSVYEKNHLKPNTKYTVEDDYAMLAMVENNLGICIMPQLLLKHSEGNSYTVLPLDPPAYRTIGIAFPPSDTPKESAVQFADFATSWIKEHTNANVPLA